MSFKFLRQTGEFALINPADVSISTSTTTGLLTYITASTTANISLGSTSAQTDGPSVSQGSSGTWFATGQITLANGGNANVAYYVRLWDGTTVINQTLYNDQAATAFTSVSLSGVIASPAGNIRLSAQPSLTGNGTIIFNQSGTSKDSTITAIRIG